MAIYVTGDTHGSQSIGWTDIDGFMHRLNTASFPEQKTMGKSDYVVILGDFGGVFGVDRRKVQESSSEKNALDWLEAKPFTTLFIPGNHENYDRLTGCRDESFLQSWFLKAMPEEEKQKLRKGYPQMDWHGGKVRCLRPSVLMLERGYIFQIDSMACFAFGGARSHDIRDGILHPADYPDEPSFVKDYRQKKDGMIRVRGVSWWEDEMPSQEEMTAGLARLRAFQAEGKKIDFIFTHEAPAEDKRILGYTEQDELSLFLQQVQQEVPCRGWFYGHLHDNKKVSPGHYLLYEQISRIH